MTYASDHWYVRLPDGRVVRAKTTKSLRYHVRSGRIPTEARVRRTPAEEWTALEWTAEFSDLITKDDIRITPPDTANRLPTEMPGKRARAPEMKVLGVRGLAGELVNALDSTLSRAKLWPAAAAGLLIGAGAALAGGAVLMLDAPWASLVEMAAALVVLLGVCVLTAALSQMTFIELSRLRPARPKEIRASLWRHALHLFFAYLFAGGVPLLLLLTLRRLPPALASADGTPLPDALLAPLIVVRTIGDVLIWPLWGSMLLFGPLAVVEDCSFARIILEWWGMARRHFGRLLLYEAMACLLGLLVAAPFLLPVLLTAPASWAPGLSGTTSQATLAVLGGLALTPLLAYLLVANVFIFLNLRYEFSAAGR